MPELPEVEIARKNLERWSVGRRVVDVRLVDPTVVRVTLSTRGADASPDADAWASTVRGAAHPPRRRAKRIGWQVGDQAFLVHLGMTGHWVRRPGGAPPRFARFGLVLDDGSTLWFTDSRRFGCVVPTPADRLDAALAEGLGPDADTLDGPALRARLTGRTALKPQLMDAARVGGLGNIHAAEALFRARLSPFAHPSDLNAADWDRLATAIHDQLAHALDVTDAEEVVYLSDGGDNPFAVYDRAGQPCPRCGATLAKATQAGRTTTWCPACQPSPRAPDATASSPPSRPRTRTARSPR